MQRNWQAHADRTHVSNPNTRSSMPNQALCFTSGPGNTGPRETFTRAPGPPWVSPGSALLPTKKGSALDVYSIKRSRGVLGRMRSNERIRMQQSRASAGTCRDLAIFTVRGGPQVCLGGSQCVPGGSRGRARGSPPGGPMGAPVTPWAFSVSFS